MAKNSLLDMKNLCVTLTESWWYEPP